eukprot:scaffold657049_cov59-Prasinocladus_malaysianus.AAC.1
MPANNTLPGSASTPSVRDTTFGVNSEMLSYAVQDQPELFRLTLRNALQQSDNAIIDMCVEAAQ